MNSGQATILHLDDPMRRVKNCLRTVVEIGHRFHLERHAKV
jgi:hypothetical protein